MVASMIRGSLNMWLVSQCARLCDGYPSSCGRVSAGDQPTSLSLPAWREHVLKCPKSSGVVWLHRQWVCFSGMWMCLRAKPGDSAEDLDFLLLQVVQDACWAEH